MKHPTITTCIFFLLCTTSPLYAATTTYLPPIPYNPGLSGVYGPGIWPGIGNNIIVAPTPQAPPWALPPANWPALFHNFRVDQNNQPDIIATQTPDIPIRAYACRRVMPGPIPNIPPNGYNGILVEPGGFEWRPGSMIAPMREVWAWQCAAWATAINNAYQQSNIPRPPQQQP